VRHDGDDPNNHEHRYGMIPQDSRAKPAYAAYNNLIRQLRGFRFVEQLKAAPDQWLFLFENEQQQYVLVGWAQQSAAIGDLVIASDASEINRVDLLGNSETLSRLPGGGGAVASTLLSNFHAQLTIRLA
jgi:hypothetical protein